MVRAFAISLILVGSGIQSTSAEQPNASARLRLVEKTVLKVYAATQDVGDGPCPPGCWGTTRFDCHCPWSVALQNMHEQPVHLSEKAALKVYAATQDDGDGGCPSGCWGTAPDCHCPWSVALQSMQEQVPGSHGPIGPNQAHVVTDGLLHKTVDGYVRYLEFFEDTEAMQKSMVQLARSNNFSVHLTDVSNFGKNISNYVVEEVVPNDLILATCHNPKDCVVDDEMKTVCDRRFDWQAPVDWTPPASMSEKVVSGRPFCHSPPTTTSMVYALTRFADGTEDWLIWACHVMDGADMCHVTDMTVVDERFLQTIQQQVASVVV